MISAKFSHELSGVLGAIKNSVDFIDNPNHQIKDQSVRLASYAATSAVIRLQFFRELYGYSDNPISLSRMEGLIRDFFAEKDVRISFKNLDFLSTNWNTGNHFKLFLCVTVLSQEHISSCGGEVVVQCCEDKSVRVTAFCNPGGTIVSIKRDVLTDPRANSSISVLNVQEHYAKVLANDLGLKVSVLEHANFVSYEIFK